ncbi:MAG: hypothetical protein HY900_32210 [Deltaproteobacteria bacterium]|nr:hypothetical protein [Deltaproteobacteria bacterium]
MLDKHFIDKLLERMKRPLGAEWPFCQELFESFCLIPPGSDFDAPVQRILFLITSVDVARRESEALLVRIRDLHDAPADETSLKMLEGLNDTQRTELEAIASAAEEDFREILRLLDSLICEEADFIGAAKRSLSTRDDESIFGHGGALDRLRDKKARLDFYYKQSIFSRSREHQKAGAGTVTGGENSTKIQTVLTESLVVALAGSAEIARLRRPKAPKYWLALWTRHRIQLQAFPFVCSALEGATWRAWLNPMGAKEPKSQKGRIEFVEEIRWEAWRKEGGERRVTPFTGKPAVTKGTFTDHVQAYIRKRKEEMGG